jgi:hypothetical protein
MMKRLIFKKALIHHEIDPTSKFNKLAEIYKIPYKRLLERHKGRPDRSNIEGHNKILSDDQEIALYRIIDRLKLDGIRCKLSMITNIANFILRNAHEDLNSNSPTVGKNWTG